MKNFRNIILICFLLPATSIAQYDLIVEVSESTGTAPFYVFFDATTSLGLDNDNDLVNTDFTWYFEFDDTLPIEEQPFTKGMVAGYVFENPGTYNVLCRATFPDASTEEEIISVTVSPFIGTTYYVANNGDNANDGLSVDSAWLTADFALQQLTDNTRLLFHRGDTFDTQGQDILNLQGDAKILGSYGSGALPILISDGQEVLRIRNSSDIKLMDLHLIPYGTGPFGAGGLSVVNNSSHILALRIEIEQTTGRAIFQDESDVFGVFNSSIHDFGVIGVYSGRSNRFSFVSNSVNNLIGAPQPEHGVRVQGGEKQFIAQNNFTNLADTKTALTIRGDGQRHVMIYQNIMDRLLGINPQNAQTIAAIRDVVIEANYIGQNPDYVGQSFEPSNNGINIEATHIGIRNNVIDGYRNAIFVGNDGNGVLSGLVDIHHNTVNWRPVSPQSGTSGRAVRVRDAFDVSISNNIISAPNENEGEILSQDDMSTNIIVLNNLITDSPHYIAETLPGSAADENTYLNYQTTQNSPMIDQGGTATPVFYDIFNTSRPVGTSKDLGAFEYNPTLAVEDQNNSSIVIFPIPSKDYLYCSDKNWYDQITIYNGVGKKVIEKSKAKFPVYIKDLKKGIYFIIVQRGILKRTLKFIK
ncbi:T9SS type A sorting domain-containing protein [Aquimarina brevivitae]|uniref:Putative secreted protein (Por secretion system target) n=1 Tax=Aquimarina brevivitae TaxID=323412 RepID=A0A4Q7PG98_9FLAO|nr:T9SS type A sorting domain-containing protein [Aquimarina brevivitae]RZS99543.1 putative secreted protein (Por secretion system target) [Aquimarina brevivitae]